MLPASGWRIDYLGETTFLANFSPEALASMAVVSGAQELADLVKPVQDRLPTIAPLLDDDHLVHMIGASVPRTPMPLPSHTRPAE